MLHIDRHTSQYFAELDRAFQTTPLMSSGLTREITKTFDEISTGWEKDYHRINVGVSSFNKKLVHALSDPIPTRYIGRPRPMQRKFPYMNTGELVHSYDPMEASYRWNSDNSMTITATGGGFGSSHAYMTSEGLNSSRAVHWLHWLENIFEAKLPVGEQHAMKVPDIRAVLIGYYG